jgi:cytidyltransferase-like protein
MSLVMVSGGFDPYHDGHVEYISMARRYGDVIVALNSDAWLTRKKGDAFMPFEARERVMRSISGVCDVYAVDDEDDTVCEAIRSVKPDYFAKGGDRTKHNTPEISCCDELGVQVLFGLGAKINSSSDLIKRQWGEYLVLHRDEKFLVKLLILLPGKATSLQRHAHRVEHWIITSENKYRRVEAGEVHQLRNDGDKPMKVVEVWTGDILSETDIERFA